MLALLLALQEDYPRGAAYERAGGGQGRWFSGLGQRFELASIALYGSVMMSPYLALDLVDRGELSGGCTTDIRYQDQYFALSGATALFDFGPLLARAGAYTLGWRGSAQFVTACAGPPPTLSDRPVPVSGDLIAFEAGLTLALLGYYEAPWTFRTGPSAGFLGLIELPQVAGRGGTFFIPAAVVGWSASVELAIGRPIFFSFLADVSWVGSPLANGARTLLAVGVGIAL